MIVHVFDKLVKFGAIKHWLKWNEKHHTIRVAVWRSQRVVEKASINTRNPRKVENEKRDVICACAFRPFATRLDRTNRTPRVPRYFI